MVYKFTKLCGTIMYSDLFSSLFYYYLLLLDGDRKAIYESTQTMIQQNKDYIAELRAQVKTLRERMACSLAVSSTAVVLSQINN